MGSSQVSESLCKLSLWLIIKLARSREADCAPAWGIVQSPVVAFRSNNSLLVALGWGFAFLQLLQNTHSEWRTVYQRSREYL